jgi:steroid delta-isomerase-like uncharacterized protein
MILASDYVRHESNDHSVTLAEHKHSIATLREAFPDLNSIVEDIFGERDRVAIRWSTTGTHEAEFLGVPATGRRVHVQGITLSRVVAWRIEEEWVTWDARQMLVTLGVVELGARS